MVGNWKFIQIHQMWPPPRMPVANKGLVRDPLVKMVIILVVTGILGGGFSTQQIHTYSTDL